MPLIGALFRYNNRQRTKTNLMIFIKPSVVRGPAGASDVTQDRYDYLIGEQNKLNPPPRIFPIRAPAAAARPVPANPTAPPAKSP